MTKLPNACGPQEGSKDSKDAAPVMKLTLIPTRFTKVVHFIRHGQGFHNVAGDANFAEYKNPAYLDAHLTDLGWSQTKALQDHMIRNKMRVDLVVCSPMMRALETGAGVFGRHHYTELSSPPVMREHSHEPGVRSAHPAICANGAPPFVVVELCREKLNGRHPCDQRRPLSVYRQVFPAMDFSHVKDEEDVLFVPNHTETHEQLRARGRELLMWLMGRPEQHIAVVSHSGFLRHNLSQFAECIDGVEMKAELSKHFENCELRSVVLCTDY